MAKYHYNPSTQQIGHCRALEKCPLLDIDRNTKHFNNFNDALRYSEKVLEETEGSFKTLSKPQSQEITLPVLSFTAEELEKITFKTSNTPYVLVELEHKQLSIHNSSGDFVTIDTRDINHNDIHKFINKYVEQLSSIEETTKYIKIPQDNIIKIDSLSHTYDDENVDKELLVNSKKILSLKKRKDRKQWVKDLQEKHKGRKIFTSDGSFVEKDKKSYGVYGCIDLEGNAHVKYLSQEELHKMESNELEILSILHISELHKDAQTTIVIDSDSAYDELSANIDSPIIQQKMLKYEQEIRETRKKVHDGTIQFELVKSHTGNLMNDAIDKLLKQYGTISQNKKLSTEEKQGIAQAWSKKKAQEWN